MGVPYKVIVVLKCFLWTAHQIEAGRGFICQLSQNCCRVKNLTPLVAFGALQVTLNGARGQDAQNMVDPARVEGVMRAKAPADFGLQPAGYSPI